MMVEENRRARRTRSILSSFKLRPAGACATCTKLVFQSRLLSSQPIDRLLTYCLCTPTHLKPALWSRPALRRKATTPALARAKGHSSR